ncbi:hypothetical protein L917_01681 [Phytophthora nicotianae]|uniref:Uncharacterized protein n=1 Tax=Phytophthora nicotianae TaxID=4792 RepID=W2LW84_PHYNI|nr:hypothetical protein L917_01681 [Phytophthora nicotianae]
MLRNHKEHPFSVEAGAQRKNRVQHKPKPKKQRTLEVSVAMSSDEVRVLSTGGYFWSTVYNSSER